MDHLGHDFWADTQFCFFQSIISALPFLFYLISVQKVLLPNENNWSNVTDTPQNWRKWVTSDWLRPCGEVCVEVGTEICLSWSSGSPSPPPAPLTKTPEPCVNTVRSACVVLIRTCGGYYIRTLLPGAAFGLQAEDLLLDLHQLTPQGVLLCQDAGDHGLGFISGQVRLKGRRQAPLH